MRAGVSKGERLVENSNFDSEMFLGISANQRFQSFVGSSRAAHEANFLPGEKGGAATARPQGARGSTDKAGQAYQRVGFY